jgi:hypothetical protein
VGTGFPSKIMLKQGAVAERRRRFRLELLGHPVTMTRKKKTSELIPIMAGCA